MDDSLRSHLRALIADRHPVSSPSGLRQAQAYLAEQFRRMRLDVSLHPFRAFGGTYQNVIASIHPAADAAPPNPPPLIIAAHYDTVAGSPGADDNASGLVVMLEAARVLGAMPLAREIRFIAFCLEEEDLLGSLAYVASLKAAGEDIAGAIVLECVGYTNAGKGSQLIPAATPIAVPDVGDFLAIVGNEASSALVKTIERTAGLRVPDLKTVSLVIPGKGEGLPDVRRSDHAAFWHYGYSAVMLTDTANFRNPHYHHPTDTLETLDIAFIQKVVQAVVATATGL
jgi:aminopeptidase YwaD